jgi:hypothetical protein
MLKKSAFAVMISVFSATAMQSGSGSPIGQQTDGDIHQGPSDKSNTNPNVQQGPSDTTNPNGQLKPVDGTPQGKDGGKISQDDLSQIKKQ